MNLTEEVKEIIKTLDFDNAEQCINALLNSLIEFSYDSSITKFDVRQLMYDIKEELF
jgi:hypothetical protein